VSAEEVRSQKSGVRIVPAARLIWLVALIGFPAAVIGGFAGRAVIAAVAVAAGADALVRKRAVSGLGVHAASLVRSFKDRASEIAVRVENPAQRARRIRVGIAAPEGIESGDEEQLVELPAGARMADFPWRYTPRRRGRYHIEECFLEASSPLGLWTVRQRIPIECELRVYPNLRRNNDLRALRRGSDGLHLERQLGRGREFEKLREYVAGDGFDEIHWKATARRGRPITKVFQVERTQEIYVVIDASRLSARPAGDETALERSIAAALIVGAAAERRGDLFGLAAFSHQVEAFTRARNGKSHYAACRDAIYQIQPRPTSPDFEEICMFLRLRLRRRAMLLFLTSLDDPVLAESFSRATQLLARRHLVMAGMLRPPLVEPLFQNANVASAEDVYRSLAGHLAWKKLRELESSLARHGVRLALFDAENFGGSLVALYDEVKQRQLL
jgi:uncharacterized protein (DUF58 family)